MKSNLVNKLASGPELSHAIGVSLVTIHDWRKRGIITPEIAERRCIRWDIEKVREQLRERAKQRALETDA